MLLLFLTGCGGPGAPVSRTPPAPLPAAAGSEERTLQAMLHQQRHALEILGLCADKARHAELVSFCKQLSAEHGQAAQTLQNWLAAWYPQAKPLSAAEHGTDQFRTFLARMRSSAGPKFDEAFLRGMRVHHRQGADDAKACQAQVTHAELKTFCANEGKQADQEVAQFSRWICDWFHDCL